MDEAPKRPRQTQSARCKANACTGFVVFVVVFAELGAPRSHPHGATVARSPKPAGDGGSMGVAPIPLVNLSSFLVVVVVVVGQRRLTALDNFRFRLPNPSTKLWKR